jgi:CHAD domain-containing protein
VTKIELRAEQTYGEAAQSVLAARSSDVFAHGRERVLDPSRAEGVHKMRVASRRLRAALEIFAPAFPQKRLRTTLAEVKLLAAALGERRDCDVQIELLESLREDGRRSERQAIEDLLADLRHEQQLANEHLAGALEHTDDARLEQRLRRLAR